MIVQYFIQTYNLYNQIFSSQHSLKLVNRCHTFPTCLMIFQKHDFVTTLVRIH